MKKYAFFLIPLALSVVLAYTVYTQTGIIILQVVNEPPKIISLALKDSAGNTVAQGSILKLADASGNPLPYYLEVSIEDNNTLQDIRRIEVYIYKDGASVPSKYDFFNFTYDVWNNVVTTSIPDINVSVDSLPDLNLTSGTFRFKITFPKTAESVGSPKWNVLVRVYDASNNATANLADWFDFDFYAEYSITPMVVLYAPAGQTVNGYIWVNISVINAPAKLKIYTNHTYMILNGKEYTGWPINNTVSLIVDGKAYPVNVTLNITGPAENVNKQIQWTFKVPLTVPTGNYTLYYFIELSR